MNRLSDLQQVARLQCQRTTDKPPTPWAYHRTLAQVFALSSKLGIIPSLCFERDMEFRSVKLRGAIPHRLRSTRLTSEPTSRATCVLQNIRTGRIFTASVQTDPDIETPYTVRLKTPAAEAEVDYLGSLVPELEVRLLYVFGNTEPYYYPQRDTSGQPINTMVNINIERSCMTFCKGCYRPPRQPAVSIDEIIEGLSRDLDGQLSRIKYIGIITGSRQSEQEQMILFVETVEALRAAGFSATFGVWSSMITSSQSMKALRALGTDALVFTTEAFTPRGQLAFSGHSAHHKVTPMEERLQAIREAQQIFKAVNATLILGLDDPEALKERVETFLRESRAAIHYSVARSYSLSQWEALSAEAKKQGVEHLCHFAKVLDRHNRERMSLARLQHDLGVIGMKQNRYSA